MGTARATRGSQTAHGAPTSVAAPGEADADEELHGIAGGFRDPRDSVSTAGAMQRRRCRSAECLGPFPCAPLHGLPATALCRVGFGDVHPLPFQRADPAALAEPSAILSFRVRLRTVLG
eukprot:5049407-Pyramimonas_sp.AAC.1